MPRLAYVTEWFPPEPGKVAFWVAEAMRDRGFDVGVVTGIPYYPETRPIGGYGAFDWLVERRSGMRVLRVPEYPSHDSSAARRTASYASFAASSALLATRAIGGADVSLVYSSPATSALAAMTARFRYGTPYVLHIQDLWPDSIFATGFLTSPSVKPLARASVDAFIKATYQYASHICVITPGMRSKLIDRGVPAKKITLVYNWVDEETIKPVEPNGDLRSQLGLGQDSFVALYAGNLGEAQALRPWVAAISRLEEIRDVHLVFLGTGTQVVPLREESSRHGVSERVHFIDRVGPSEVPALVSDADVSVISLADRPLFEITIPSKVQATMAMASPIVASVSGDPAEVLAASGAGWVARPEDVDSIAGALSLARAASPRERRARGEAGLHYYRTNMAREIGATRLASILLGAVDGASSRVSEARED